MLNQPLSTKLKWRVTKDAEHSRSLDEIEEITNFDVIDLFCLFLHNEHMNFDIYKYFLSKNIELIWWGFALVAYIEISYLLLAISAQIK